MTTTIQITKHTRYQIVDGWAKRNYKGALAVAQMSFMDYLKITGHDFNDPDTKITMTNIHENFDWYARACVELEWELRLKAEEEAARDMKDAIEAGQYEIVDPR